MAASGDSSFEVRLQEACDDLHYNPEDVRAQMQVLALLGGRSEMSPQSWERLGRLVGDVFETEVRPADWSRLGLVVCMSLRLNAAGKAWRRLVKIVCDELHDDPADVEAQQVLRIVAVASGGLTNQ